MVVVTATATAAEADDLISGLFIFDVIAPGIALCMLHEEGMLASLLGAWLGWDGVDIDDE